MKESSKTFTQQYHFTSKDCDHRSLVKPSALINYFIQIAWENAEHLHMGFSHLQEENKAWVLSKFTLQLDKVPTWPGCLYITTWPKGLNRLLYLRDALLFNDANEQIGKMTSDWLVIDVQSKRPKLLSGDNEKHYHPVDALPESTPKIAIEGEEDYVMEYTVRYNDIDVNHHLTTVRYLELLWDTFDLDFIESTQLECIHANFIKEIKFGTNLIIERYKTKSSFQFRISSKELQKVYFCAEMTFKLG